MHYRTPPRKPQLRKSLGRARATGGVLLVRALHSPATSPWCLIPVKCVNRCLISAICVRRTRIWPDSGTKTLIWPDSRTRRPARVTRCLIPVKCVNRCLISAICVRRTRIWPDSGTKTLIWRESGTRGLTRRREGRGEKNARQRLANKKRPRRAAESNRWELP